jgi:hypothetical protein
MDKYVCIVKTPDKHLKYHVNDLIKFTSYLDSKYDWKYFNVYDKKTRQQIGNFTINNKPTSRRINM